MTVDVLGPLTIDGDSPSPRERMVLSALVVRRGHAIAAAELADATWGEDLPATWPKQVQAAVSRLRRMLGDGAIATVGGRYALRLPPDAVDAWRFEALVERARELRALGYPGRAVDRYRHALALWRGDPLPDLPDWTEGVAEADRLRTLRSVCEEELLAERLRSGDARSSLAEAERLVRGAPLREPRWALLALANYRVGRQAEALAVIRSARELLAAEVGLEPGHELVDLEARILRQDPSLDAPGFAVADETCPYRGLAPFEAEDAEEFFGRDDEVDEILAAADPGAFVLIAGPSGVGKSSILRAGVAPRLRARGLDTVVVRPGSGGIAALQRAIDVGVAVVAVDQLEELVQQDAASAHEYLDRVRRFAEERGIVIATIRSEFIDRLAGLAGEVLVTARVLVVPPMRESGLRSAIEAPAVRAGLTLEPGLVEVALRDAAGHGAALPHLSHALVETWNRREADVLTVAGYEAAGGLAGAIANSAERFYQGLDAVERELCRTTLLRLVARGPDGGPMRRLLSLRHVESDEARLRVLARLSEARLVSVEDDGILLAHESVGAAWPRLHGWLEADASTARVRDLVTTSAEAWEADGRTDDALLRGARLEAAREWRQTSQPDLTVLEAEFLDASERHEESVLDDLRRRNERERRRNRVLRWALAGAATFLAAAVVSGSIALVSAGDSARAAEDAQIEALASTALALRDSDRSAAALLAAELHRRWPDDSRTRSALWGVVTAGGGLISRTVFETGARVAGAVVPGRREVLLVQDLPATGDADVAQSMQLVDLDTGDVLREFDIELPPAETLFDRDVAVSGDGSTALVQTPGFADDEECCVNHLTVVDLGSGSARIPTVSLATRTGFDPMLAEDGSVAYLTHSVTGTPIAIDTRTGAPLGPIPPLTDAGGRFAALSSGRDGSLLLGTTDGVAVHDPLDLRRVGFVPAPAAHTEWVVAETADGALFVSGYDGMALIDRLSGEPRWRRSAGDECLAAVLPPATSTVLCRERTGVIRELRLDDGVPTGRDWETRSDLTTVIDLVGEREFVTLASRSGPFLAHWRMDGAPAVARPIADGAVAVGGFGAGDRLVVIARGDGTANPDNVQATVVGEMQLWDVEEDRPVGRPAASLGWIGDDHLLRSAAIGSDPEIVDARTDAARPLPFGAEGVAQREGGPLDDGAPEVRVFPGGYGGLAFVIGETEIQPIRPESGEIVGTPIRIPGVEVGREVYAVSELADADATVVTWFDEDEGRAISAVFDLDTGEEIARGLADDGGVIALPGGDVLSSNTSRLTRSTSGLDEVSAIPISGAEPRTLQVSRDGETLLVDGWDDQLTLYDLTDGRPLGSPLPVTVQNGQNWPAGFLSSDGTRLLTNSPTGVLVWDLRAGPLVDAACRMAGRPFTDLEWRTYFGDVPRTDACAIPD